MAIGSSAYFGGGSANSGILAVGEPPGSAGYFGAGIATVSGDAAYPADPMAIGVSPGGEGYDKPVASQGEPARKPARKSGESTTS
ncbi:hypothetical protein D3876_04020 [Sphingomonas cavernae]|uniref:Uncharacterized protein n=1 Tax=Sphingomonas cavernae TaxID=2320861 RepID=A0A418WQM5_9SPHN|nr:hypothetical protein D3876_04020 [Sphingomonas cavernae]